MDVRKLRKVVELLDEFDIAEIRIQQDKTSLEVIRKHKVKHVSAPVFSGPQNTHSDIVPDKFPDSSKKEDASLSKKPEKQVKSPMVGTFYIAPSPDAEPFIKVGQKISVGDTICIIEAMKVMNEIKAEKSGVIQRILIDDASSVQFGQGLFIIA